MIQKQMKRLEEHEAYINNLSASQIEHNLLREDFYLYNCMHKDEKLIFEAPKVPEEKLFSLIEDCAVGSYDQLEQLELRLKEVLNVSWEHDRITKLREKYITERHQIVGSGLTLRQLSHLLEPCIQKFPRDPLASAFSTLLTPMPDKPYFYQFMDSAFLILENSKEKSQYKQTVSKNNKNEIQIKLSEKSQQTKQRNNEKIGEVIGLFHKMSAVIDKNEGNEKNKKEKDMDKKIERKNQNKIDKLQFF